MTDPVYENYWTRKRLRAQAPHFRVLASSGQRLDDEVLGVISRATQGKTRLLDVGAGSLEVRDALLGAGFSGHYETLDIGDEYSYTYRSIDQVSGSFDAILLLDVIEHLPLADGLGLLRRLLGLLGERGVLVVQTPNGRCVRSPFSSDMTHVHSYNLPDLWAYVKSFGYDVDGYRVSFRQNGGLVKQMFDLAGRAMITRLLGLDYADNILLVATTNYRAPATLRGTES